MLSALLLDVVECVMFRGEHSVRMNGARRNIATGDGVALVAYVQFPFKLFADG